MKRIIILLIITLISGLPVCTQAQLDRQPFSQPTLHSYQEENLPNDNSGNGSFIGGTGSISGGPMDELPNGDSGDGGFVGNASVRDALWIIPLLAVGYTAWKRRRIKNWREAPSTKSEFVIPDLIRVPI